MRKSRVPDDRWSLFGIILAAVWLLAATILIWDVAAGQGKSSIDDRFFGSRIALFAVAGAFGAVLRSTVYLLAFPSLTPRERSQWRLEAVLAPPLGAITGILMYFLVVTAIVDSPQAISLEAQYLVSLGTGAVTVTQFGKWAERGLMRSALSRSGIIGTEGSTSVPVIERIDRLLETRVRDLTYTNWRGLVTATLRRDADGNGYYSASVLFRGLPNWSLEELNQASEDQNGLEAEPREARTNDVARSSITSPASANDGAPRTRLAAIATQAGDDREVALFSVRASSTWLEAVPLQLSVEAPREGEAVIAWLELRPEARAEGAPPARRGENLVLEIAQGPKTVQVISLPMPER